jgi:Glycosyl hydrolase family 20, domain 2
VTVRCLLFNLLILCSAGGLWSEVRIVPTPQHFEMGTKSVSIPRGGFVQIILGPLKSARNEKLQLAADFLRRDLEQADSSMKVEIETESEKKTNGPRIYLWDYSADSKPGVNLNLLDHKVLTSSDHYGQGYVLRTLDPKSIWIVGSSDAGVLLGAMSALQLIEKAADGVSIQGAYIRDYPDFRYRTGADWLLFAEINGWSLDWGQGVEAYKRLCERELDEALRFKINMVFFDGFGWGLKQRFDGYGELMRSINQYARARGIHLEFGGYGARYGIVDAGMSYLGEPWKNRESYPDGSTYQCMGSEMGTCRANEHLNRLKADELREFVRTVEPGALYIHHEDTGLNKFEPMWKKRDDRCRKRWPNDSITAVDGAVGALAHLDSELIEAISSVKNPDGYDAARDCVIILVSPGYGPDSMSSVDWSNTLKFWANYSSQLPPSDNILICFGGSSISAIFPPPDGSKGWIELFNSLMAQQGHHVGSYVYFAGGAERFYTDYPLTGTPALTAMFYGATGIYYSTGNFYAKPLAVINAEYSWNRHSTGFFRNPKTFDDAMHHNLAYMFAKNYPPEIFGTGGIFEHACELLYGPKAGTIMASYYKESHWVPETKPENSELNSLQWYLESSALPMPSHYQVSSWAPSATGQDRQLPAQLSAPEGDYLPLMWNRVYAIPEHAKDVGFDSKTWNGEIDDSVYATRLSRLHIDTQELHRRLARRWTIVAELNAKGASYIDEALSAAPRPSSMSGLEFLKTSFEVDQPLLEALADFHRGMQQYYAAPTDKKFRDDLQKALIEAKRAEQLSTKAFPHPIDPVDGSQPYGPPEIKGILTFSKLLVQTIEQRLQ